MSTLTRDDVLRVTEGALLLAASRRGVRRVSTDSRDIRAGDLFVALKGEHFDGHGFVVNAIADGAVGVVVTRRQWPAIATRVRRYVSRVKAAAWVVGVKHSLAAYQALGAHHRTRFEVPVVAVTGSNGKTTTKDLVAHVLSTRWHVLKTEANFNNRLGVPKTLLRMTPRHEAMVIEMGVDREGQTTQLCALAQPTVGVITNVGPDHLEFFGSMEGSARAKAELLPALPMDGLAVLNADDAYYRRFRRLAPCRVVSYGFSKHAEVRASAVEIDAATTSFLVHRPQRRRPIRVTLRVPGQHNVANALAAVAVAHGLGISGRAIVDGLARMRPAAMRSEVHHINGATFLHDCYNANPASMEAALDVLADLAKGQRTIAVLGEMKELGRDAAQWHYHVGECVAQKHISLLVCCGRFCEHVAEGAAARGMPGAAITTAANVPAAATRLARLLAPGDVVLLKASRSVRMERVLERIQQ